VKKPQWITIAAAVVLVAAIYSFGKTVPEKKKSAAVSEQHSPDDGHGHGTDAMSTDTILALAHKQLTPEQSVRLNTLRNSVSRGDVKDQQLKIFHQLSHFWRDSAKMFEPYAWYVAEAARLENSENSLTFAAHLFLENLRDFALRKWKALQAKDLFERSLKINAANDSSKIGLGASYLFGNITDNPMEGISRIREVTDRDSTNVFANMILAKASVMSGQTDKAIERLMTVNRFAPSNLEAILMLADIFERTRDNKNAIYWYGKSLPLVTRGDVREEIEKRINELKK
jgi:tetratricopeptide (TPR) repeat protein